MWDPASSAASKAAQANGPQSYTRQRRPDVVGERAGARGVPPAIVGRLHTPSMRTPVLPSAVQPPSSWARTSPSTSTRKSTAAGHLGDRRAEREGPVPSRLLNRMASAVASAPTPTLTISPARRHAGRPAGADGRRARQRPWQPPSGSPRARARSLPVPREMTPTESRGSRCRTRSSALTAACTEPSPPKTINRRSRRSASASTSSVSSAVAATVTSAPVRSVLNAASTGASSAVQPPDSPSREGAACLAPHPTDHGIARTADS